MQRLSCKIVRRLAVVDRIHSRICAFTSVFVYNVDRMGMLPLRLMDSEN